MTGSTQCGYQQFLKAREITPNMFRKSSYLVIARIENFSGVLKPVLFYLTEFKSLD